MPTCTILAGPNGAGESTAAPQLVHSVLGIDEFVNADVIARGLAGSNSRNILIRAGRLMIERLRQLADAGEDFAFANNLSSRARPRKVEGFREVMNGSKALDLQAERRALKRSANLMLRRHRALGLPIVTSDEGRVVHIDPETMREIPPSEVADFIARAQASWDLRLFTRGGRFSAAARVHFASRTV